MHHLATPSPQSSPSSSPTHQPPSPPALLSPPTTTTSSVHVHAHASPTAQHARPSIESERHVAAARAAVVASLSNLFDSELQSRAGVLHGNAAALDRQERDVLRATDKLRREREKLAREADRAARKVKELGNVQNWAEVLERGFLVLEETVRLANGASCSCSECGGSDDDDGGRDVDGESAGEEEDEGGDAEDVVVDAEEVMDVDLDVPNSLHDGGDRTMPETGKDANSAVLMQQNGQMAAAMTAI
ncbi:hypothetical protein E4U21_007305 [Claviceps maximensis]|nr:hypothetical protein E4U21_007305 [Claviceps maximensis]